MKKRKILLIILLILVSFTAINTYSRYTKSISKDGTISTAEIGYCKLHNIKTLRECLIRNDSQQELTPALETISTRTLSVNLASEEPVGVYIPQTKYTDITNKTNNSGIVTTVRNRFAYVVENKLITEFDTSDEDIKNISFSSVNGRYTLTNYSFGNKDEVVTTQEDMNNGIYKYVCIRDDALTYCESLYLVTEAPYNYNNQNHVYKQGYTYSYKVVGTSTEIAALYKGEDDYTINNDNYTYYYRGGVKNNWVSFGGFLWRVIRINGDGSIRMIYSGLKDAPNHTGANAQVKYVTFGDTTTQSTQTLDITGLTSDMITTTYSNGRYGNTYVGYMYNPLKEIATYPTKELNNTNRLNTFPNFNNINDAQNIYFFKNFNPSTDCFLGNGNDETGACTLKCKASGKDGDTGVDCIQSNWNTLAATQSNISSTAQGVYPASNPTNFVYTSEYKYTCFGYGTPVTHPNSDGTTSVYVTCPIVSEILGTVKDRPTEARVRYHGLFSPSAAVSKQNVKDSNIKKEVDMWYQNNIFSKQDDNSNSLEKYLSDGIFCNDRTSITTEFPITNTGTSYLYGTYTRLVSNKLPSFKCPDKSNDAFTLKQTGATSTVTPNGNGNNILSYPVGLITADEANFGGGLYSIMNPNYYLYTGSAYWILSPDRFSAYNASANVWYMNGAGYLNASNSANSYGLRPVINLKSDILYSSGQGTEEDPYTIELPSV